MVCHILLLLLQGNISFNENGSRRIDTVELNQYRYAEDGLLRAIPIGTVHRRDEFKFEIVYRDNMTSLWTGIVILITTCNGFVLVYFNGNSLYV